MVGSQDSRRQSKRSRAGDAAMGKTMQTDDVRIKRRRTSQINNDMIKSHKSLECKENKNRGDNLNTSTATSVTTVQKTQMLLNPWSSTSVVAGQYSNLDPIFTPDDEYLLLGLETAVHVYSLATSRLIRTLQAKDGDSIVGYKLSPEDSKILYIFTLNGSISKWEWLSGEQSSYWDTCHKTISVEVCLTDAGSDCLFFLRERKDGKRGIAIEHSSDEKSRENIILETNVQINNLKIASQGQFIMAYGDQNVFFGRTRLGKPSEPAQYTWREVNLPVNIMCIDVRHNATSNRSAARSPRDRKQYDKIDLVLGELGGSILIYHDILRFLDDEEGRQNGKTLTPRRLHWHRSSVNSVRWSKDGNYIISGGNESVMVLWQLDTGRKQFLPHLSSPIGNIAVSTSGNSYAVKLADNSIIVLSARELQPSSIITGLQLCPKMTNADGENASGVQPSYGAVAAALHPQNPDQLLITVPASRQTTREGHPLVNASTLQTYDIRTNSHISRQALARTNATTLKISPEGSHIVTPDVSHLSVSKDGKWMATIDNWSPNVRDMQALYYRDSGFNRLSEDSQEIFLKFWRWSSSSNLWELVTRIDSPHFSDKGPARVLHIAARAHSTEFATIGSDAVLRFWCPSIRQRSGLKSDGLDQPTETWKCRSAVDLKTFFDVGMAGALSAASMDFSQDGSVLAVCLGTTTCLNRGLAILIDAQKCTVRYSRVGLYMDLPSAAAFVGCNLVIASRQSVSIWDTVDDLVRTIELPGPGDISSNQPRLLAVNPETQTFAVSAESLQSPPVSRKNRLLQSHIQVYDMSVLSLLSETVLRRHPVALLSAVHSSDYVVVDSAANVQRIGRLDKSLQSNSHSLDLTTHLIKGSGLANLFGQQDEGKPQDSQYSSMDFDWDTQNPQKELASVFDDAPPFVMPPANMIFRNVVDVLSG
ncbi:WD40 repeat-like protein [Aspergillus sclerotioniger CBS 115572]|uniref:WD40 repeat-like protein n=1 Tax=Aspergillus sclerotioniger CBS 115572 TaxID=1450535 RepID=A0A317W1X5_9EURO|nr:WD40 repeat-like protein [Aspergillus sclerotioniger CBS 115572]PWY78180.1 WD40 repeat-like protein [Aspergillus sclerotioniger CBS 115572]